MTEQSQTATREEKSIRSATGYQMGVKPFTPSSTDLTNMIKAAEAKFAADRERCLRERFERANAINAQLKREERQHNARRYLNVGDTP